MNILLSSAPGILAILVLVLLNGFFVAAEFALVSVRRSRIDQLVSEGSRAARGVQKALVHLDTYIAATQLGITMASLALGFVGEPALAHLIEPLFHGFLPPKGAAITSHGVAIGIAFAIVTALHIVLGELAPKSIALQRPDATALVVTAPLDIFLMIFRPFIYILNATGNVVVRLFGLQAASEHAAVHSVEELQLLVHSTHEAGLLEDKQEQMVTRAFQFQDTIIRKVMTPRLDVVAIRADATIDDLMQLMTTSEHLRLPVYEDNLDNIVGVVYIKDLLKALAGPTKPTSIREVMQAPYLIPETRRAGSLLTELQHLGRQIAIVRDERGTVSGVVTIEDLLEEIVGEIQETPADEDELLFVKIADRTYLVDGRMMLEDFNEKMGTQLAIEQTDTLGGFVFSLLGHQPSLGEKVTADGLQLQVEETDTRRVQKVRVICSTDRPGLSQDSSVANRQKTS